MVLVLVLSVSSGYALDTQKIVALGVLTAVVSGGLAGTLLAFPVAVPYVAGAALIAMAGGSLFYSSQPSSGTNKPVVSTSGDVRKPANVVWVDMVDNVPTVKKGDIIAKVSQASLAAAASSNPTKYPKLAAANQVAGSYGAPASTMTQGSKFSTDAANLISGTPGNYTVGTVNYGPAAYADYVIKHYKYEITGSAPHQVLWFYYPNPYNSGRTYRIAYNITSATPPSSTVATPAQFAQKLANASSPLSAPADVYSDYYAEIDAFIHDEPNVVHFEDGSTSGAGNVPLTPPPAATAVQVNTALAASAAANQTAAAKSAYDQAAAASAANPGDTGLSLAAANALTAYKSAQALQAQAEAARAQAEQDSEQAGSLAVGSDNSYSSFSTSDLPVKTDIFAAVRDFLSSSPLGSLIRRFGVTTSGSTSTVSFQFHGQTITGDMAQWSGVLGAAGTVLLSLTHAYALYLIFRRS